MNSANFQTISPHIRINKKKKRVLNKALNKNINKYDTLESPENQKKSNI